MKKEVEIDIDNILQNINDRNPVRLRENTPKILVANGIKDLPMYENPSHIRKNILTEEEAKLVGLKIDSKNHYHGLGKEIYMRVIESLDNPRVVFKLINTKEYLIITIIKNQRGESVVVPIEIETTTNVNKVKIEINRIKSVYGYEIKNGHDLNNYIKYNIINKKFIKIYEPKKERGAGSSTAASSSITTITQKNINSNLIHKEVVYNIENEERCIKESCTIYTFINRNICSYFV